MGSKAVKDLDKILFLKLNHVVLLKNHTLNSQSIKKKKSEHLFCLIRYISQESVRDENVLEGRVEELFPVLCNIR